MFLHWHIFLYFSPSQSSCATIEMLSLKQSDTLMTHHALITNLQDSQPYLAPIKEHAFSIEAIVPIIPEEFTAWIWHRKKTEIGVPMLFVHFLWWRHTVYEERCRNKYLVKQYLWLVYMKSLFRNLPQTTNNTIKYKKVDVIWDVK